MVFLFNIIYYMIMSSFSQDSFFFNRVLNGLCGHVYGSHRRRQLYTTSTIIIIYNSPVELKIVICRCRPSWEQKKKPREETDRERMGDRPGRSGLAAVGAAIPTPPLPPPPTRCRLHVIPIRIVWHERVQVSIACLCVCVWARTHI